MKRTAKQTVKKSLPYLDRYIFFGILVILLFVLLRNTVAFVYYSQVMSHLTVKQMQARAAHPDMAVGFIAFLFSVLSIVTFTYAGYLGSKNEKDRPWIKGALVGVGWNLILFLCVLALLGFYTWFPTVVMSHPSKQLQAHYHEIFIQPILHALPLTLLNTVIPFTALGGWLRKKFPKKS